MKPYEQVLCTKFAFWSRYQHGVAELDSLYEPVEDLQTSVKLDLGQSGQQTVSYFHLHRDHVDWVFVDHPAYHRPGETSCHMRSIIIFSFFVLLALPFHSVMRADRRQGRLSIWCPSLRHSSEGMLQATHMLMSMEHLETTCSGMLC